MKFLRNLFSSKASKTSTDNQIYTPFTADTLHNLKRQQPEITIEQITFPDLGQIKDLKINQWYKNEGDLVNVNETICSISTPKHTMDFQVFMESKIVFKTPPNTPLKVGDIICVISV